jgi:hypothetical protein
MNLILSGPLSSFKRVLLLDLESGLEVKVKGKERRKCYVDANSGNG